MSIVQYSISDTSDPLLIVIGVEFLDWLNGSELSGGVPNGGDCATAAYGLPLAGAGTYTLDN